MSFLMRKWTDAEKWGMGITASLLLATIFGIWQMIFAEASSPPSAADCSSADTTVAGDRNVVPGNCNNGIVIVR